MAVSRTGKILSTSTGFAPDQTQAMPDYESAMHASSGYGYWIGKLTSGEKVMAITRVVRGANGAVLGAVRYVASMERACLLYTSRRFRAGAQRVRGRAARG